MKRVAFGFAVLVAGLLSASAAQASTFTWNFCPGNASCNANLTEASISFTDISGGDPNDYTVTIKFVGTLTNMFIDAVQFTTDLALSGTPTLTSAPSGTAIGDWSVVLNGNVNANGCQAAGSNNKDACAVDVNGNGPDFNGNNIWVFSVNFDGAGTIGANSSVNLRALFVDDTGKQSGILSPDGKAVTTTTTVTPTTDTTPTTGNIPEPALISMLGVGLAGAAYRARRRS